MSTDLPSLADTLRTQLGALSSGTTVSADAANGLTVGLTPEAAQALSSALSSHRSSGETADDQAWNATTERVSEIEGFTGGEPAE